MLVLNPLVLNQTMRWRRDMMGLRNQAANDLNKSMRYAAYTQQTYMEYGFLGRANRRPAPSCIVWRIRDAFPDEHGAYVDYVPTRF